MTYPLFSFTSTPQSQDSSSQAGLQQYIQQGQSQISPGQAQIAQSNPISAGAVSSLAKAFAQAQQQGPQGTMPIEQAQNAMTYGAATNPNVNGQNMGGVGPTQQNLMMAHALQNQYPLTPIQQFINPSGD